MNIAFFHNLNPGGAKRVIYNQIQYLVGQGHQVMLYCPPASQTKKDFLDFSQLKCEIIELPELVQQKNSNRFIKDFKLFFQLPLIHQAIARKIDQGKYDVVIVHHDIFTQTPYVLQFLKTPHIYYCEELLRIAYEPGFGIPKNLAWPNRIYEQLYRLGLKLVDKKNAQAATEIIANSKFTAKKVEDAYGKKPAVIFPSVNIQEFKPLPRKEIYDVLFIGEPVEINGYDLFEAAQNLLPKSLKIRLISPATEKLVTDQKIIESYNESKIVLSLARQEPFGLVPPEAMACGRAVIAWRDGGYVETVEDWKTGYLVETTQELAQKITELLADEKKRSTFGKLGRKIAEKRFSIEATGEQLIKLIKKYST